MIAALDHDWNSRCPTCQRRRWIDLMRRSHDEPCAACIASDARRPRQPREPCANPDCWCNPQSNPDFDHALAAATTQDTR